MEKKINLTLEQEVILMDDKLTVKKEPEQCEYCKYLLSTCLITPFMQPSFVHYSCDKCSEQEGFMIVEKFPNFIEPYLRNRKK